MSRSTRHPMVVMTNQIDKGKAHRIVRKRVKEVLQTMDYEDIPIFDIEADTRSLGLEEWGTKIGFDVSEILNEEDNRFRNKISRK